MSNFFEQNSNPETGVSLCIPRVFNNINYRRIKKSFIDLRWGFVERVDVIPMGQYKRAFVHFAPGRWNNRDRDATNALRAMKNKEEVKIVYDDPWFWKISISTVEKPKEPPKPKARPKVEIGRTDSAPKTQVEEGEVEESKTNFVPTTPPHSSRTELSYKRNLSIDTSQRHQTTTPPVSPANM